ncbi:MAG: carboxymuconolactone decarboxylase family protein [Acidimicrobiia bacterium]|nr:carboxymuconolactone decarboxylase family protein [Acidimicrobiia bacterium]MDH5237757.1 carboxymuconolactone decarboxylase family protein [Acidimicrobiia bacterium]
MTHPLRMPLVSDDDATPPQRELLDRLRRPDGSVLNIFRALANHPDLARRWLVFGSHVLTKSTLPDRLRELAILRVGWRCGSDYEFGQHVLIAREVGLTDPEIGRVKAGPDDQAWSPVEATTLRAADELHEHQVITDATWTDLRRHLDDQQCMDLVFAVGQYTLVSMALNTFGVPRDEDVPGFD